MGDPIKYKGQHVGYIGGMNHGKSNDGFFIRFESLDAMIEVLSLPDSEEISIGRDTDTTTIGEFKDRYINQDGLRIYSSREMQFKDEGVHPTALGIINKKYKKE